MIQVTFFAWAQAPKFAKWLNIVFVFTVFEHVSAKLYTIQAKIANNLVLQIFAEWYENLP